MAAQHDFTFSHPITRAVAAYYCGWGSDDYAHCKMPTPIFIFCHSHTYEGLLVGFEAEEFMPAEAKSNNRILVVEDNQLVVRALGELLRDEGYEPVIFTNGMAALEYARDQCPGAALIDLHLPDISGLEITQQLRESHGEELPIIILSGDSSMDTLRSLPRAGATYFFSKPINAAILLDQLKEWLA